MSTGVTAKDRDQGLGQRDVIGPMFQHRDNVASERSGAAEAALAEYDVVANRRRRVSRLAIASAYQRFWARSRELRLDRRYRESPRMMISRLKWRPLKSRWLPSTRVS
jgi:hypothetical protein